LLSLGKLSVLLGDVTGDFLIIIFDLKITNLHLKNAGIILLIDWALKIMLLKDRNIIFRRR
jgi:hypothetical protein